MYFPLRPENFAAILDHYSRQGFVVLTGVNPRIASVFRSVISSFTGLTEQEIERGGNGRPLSLSREARAAVARPDTLPEMQELLTRDLGDLLTELLGPIIHISHTYHPQIKTGVSEGYAVEGYSGDGAEVRAQYALHQDFTAGRKLTSPAAIVCWIPLNRCDQNTLRLYSKSHSQGMLARNWLLPDSPDLDRVGPYVDIEAEPGQILLFNFLLLHGTSRPGPKLRVSCDLRFFPFCPTIDSVARVLRPNPLEWIRQRLKTAIGETLVEPLLEASLYLGEPVEWPSLKPHSVLFWSQYIAALLNRDEDGVARAIRMLTNSEVGFDAEAQFLEWERSSRVPLYSRPYYSVLPYLSQSERGRCQELLAGIGAGISR